MKIDRILIPIVASFPLATFCIAFGYPGSSLYLLALGLISLTIGGIALHKKSAPDLIFICTMNYVVGLQIISLSVWPDYPAYQNGAFSVVSATTVALDKSLLILIAINLGWLIVLLFDRCRVNVKSIEKNFENIHFTLLVAWFSLSIIAIIFSAIFLNVGIAGVESDFNYIGFLYYLFPADYLALVITIGLGFKVSKIENHKGLLLLLVGLYIIVKLLCGWKSPLLNVILAYAIGIYYTGKIEGVFKKLILSLLVVTCYIYVLKPIADVVRTGEIIAKDSSVISLEDNPFASRLTEGTLYGVALIESEQRETGIGSIYFLGDLLNRLVPGTIFNIKPIDRVFTEDILAQPLGIASTFAPGSLGTAEILGGILPAIIYSMFFRTLILVIMQWSSKKHNPLARLLVLSAIPLSIVSLCTDGYTGGIERFIYVWLILIFFATILNIIIKNRSYLFLRY